MCEGGVMAMTSISFESSLLSPFMFVCLRLPIQGCYIHASLVLIFIICSAIKQATGLTYVNSQYDRKLAIRTLYWLRDIVNHLLTYLHFCVTQPSLTLYSYVCTFGLCC